MRSPAGHFLVLLLAALGLAPGAAHVLELPAKLAYSPELYAAVTSSLYGLFGTLGAAIQLGALLAAATLCYQSRQRTSFRLALWGTLALGASLLLWAAIVAPVNAQWLQVMHSHSEPLPQAYARLRHRWEFGHVAAFSAWLLGYCLLLLAVLRQDGRHEV